MRFNQRLKRDKKFRNQVFVIVILLTFAFAYGSGNKQAIVDSDSFDELPLCDTSSGCCTDGEIYPSDPATATRLGNFFEDALDFIDTIPLPGLGFLVDALDEANTRVNNELVAPGVCCQDLDKEIITIELRGKILGEDFLGRLPNVPFVDVHEIFDLVFGPQYDDSTWVYCSDKPFDGALCGEWTEGIPGIKGLDCAGRTFAVIGGIVFLLLLFVAII